MTISSAASAAPAVLDTPQLTVPQSAVQTFSPDQALLTLEDLPPGFSETVASGSGGSGGSAGSNVVSTFCGAFAQPAARAVDGAQVRFNRGRGGPFIGNSVAVFDSADGARLQLAQIRSRLAACQPQKDADGNVITFAPASAPEAGDEAVGMAITLTGDFVAGSGRSVYIRKGNVLCVLTLIGIPNADEIDFDMLARRAASKLP
jgi:hypothetical protein